MKTQRWQWLPEDKNHPGGASGYLSIETNQPVSAHGSEKIHQGGASGCPSHWGTSEWRWWHVGGIPQVEPIASRSSVLLACILPPPLPPGRLHTCQLLQAAAWSGGMGGRQTVWAGHVTCLGSIQAAPARLRCLACLAAFRFPQQRMRCTCASTAIQRCRARMASMHARMASHACAHAQAEQLRAACRAPGHMLSPSLPRASACCCASLGTEECRLNLRCTLSHPTGRVCGAHSGLEHGATGPGQLSTALWPAGQGLLYRPCP
eukprot:352948-Chlamydomonas_euryale.AAC.2